MTTYVDVSHNMLFTLPPSKWLQDLQKSHAGDVTGYQEAEGSDQRHTLKAFCDKFGRDLYHPPRCGVPISWKKNVFSYVVISDKPVRGIRHVTKSAEAMGVDAKFNPHRDFTWVGLTHKPTGKKVLRINVHTLQGGTKLEKDPDNRDSDELSKFKDWGIGQYWLDILAFTAGQMSRQDPGPQAMTPLWDIVTIGGDYNAFLDRADRWYYPGALLPALFVNDSRQRSLDHLQHGHGSDVKVARRWTQAINSDHSLHLVERTILNVPDFPRQ
jgi:hypothetical protein